MVNLLKDGNCLNKGYHIFFDNSFSSVDFVRYLYSTESYVTGTIRRSKRCIPDYLKKANMNEVKYFLLLRKEECKKSCITNFNEDSESKCDDNKKTTRQKNAFDKSRYYSILQYLHG